MNDLHYEELQNKFDSSLDDLARCDVDILQAESAMAKYAKHSPEWEQLFEFLNHLEKKRQLVAKRLAMLRVMLEAEKRRIGF